MSELDAFSAARTITAALAAANLDYAIGGALAYNLWSVPRATKDVDVNVFVDPTKVEGLLVALHGAGVAFDDDEARRGSADGGYFFGHLGALRVDVFTPSVPFSWEAMKTRVRATIDGHQEWYLSAEATAVFKLMFFRGKDVVDLERLVATQQGRVDQAYVRRWIVDMMGEDDPRTQTWDDLVRRFGSAK